MDTSPRHFLESVRYGDKEAIISILVKAINFVVTTKKEACLIVADVPSGEWNNCEFFFRKLFGTLGETVANIDWEVRSIISWNFNPMIIILTNRPEIDTSTQD